VQLHGGPLPDFVEALQVGLWEDTARCAAQSMRSRSPALRPWPARHRPSGEKVTNRIYYASPVVPVLPACVDPVASGPLERADQHRSADRDPGVLPALGVGGHPLELRSRSSTVRGGRCRRPRLRRGALSREPRGRARLGRRRRGRHHAGGAAPAGRASRRRDHGWWPTCTRPSAAQARPGLPARAPGRSCGRRQDGRGSTADDRTASCRRRCASWTEKPDDATILMAHLHPAECCPSPTRPTRPGTRQGLPAWPSTRSGRRPAASTDRW